MAPIKQKFHKKQDSNRSMQVGLAPFTTEMECRTAQHAAHPIAIQPLIETRSGAVLSKESTGRTNRGSATKPTDTHSISVADKRGASSQHSVRSKKKKSIKLEEPQSSVIDRVFQDERERNGLPKLVSFKRKMSSSKYKGVLYVRSQDKWRAQVCLGGKKKYIGSYNTELDAAVARDKKVLELFGYKHELMNFPLPYEPLQHYQHCCSNCFATNSTSSPSSSRSISSGSSTTGSFAVQSDYQYQGLQQGCAMGDYRRPEDFYHMEPEESLIIYDELQLPEYRSSGRWPETNQNFGEMFYMPNWSTDDI